MQSGYQCALSLGLALGLSLNIPLLGQSHLVTPCDCATVKYVSSLSISNAGDRVAYVVKAPDLDHNRNDFSLYIRDIADSRRSAGRLVCLRLSRLVCGVCGSIQLITDSLSAATAALASSVTLTPVSNSASVSLGVIIETSFNNSSGRGRAGAGLRMTRTPARPRATWAWSPASRWSAA